MFVEATPLFLVAIYMIHENHKENKDNFIKKIYVSFDIFYRHLIISHAMKGAP